MLNDQKISVKIMAIVGVLSLVSVGIAGFGAIGFQTLGGTVRSMDEATAELRLSSRINRYIAEINRDEYSLALDPQRVDEVAATVDERRRSIAEAIALLHRTIGPEQKALLQKVEQQLPGYYRKLSVTLDTARQARGGVQGEDGRRAVTVAVDASRVEVQTLRGSITGFLDYTEKESAEAAVDAERKVEASMIRMFAIAATGTLAGILLGLLVAQKGIVRPIRAVVASLRGLADGDLTVEVTGADRRDEVGAIAETAGIFKASLIRGRAMEEAARQAEHRAQAERKRAMLQLADEFEASVRSVVEGVSSAATQLQSTARTMAAIAEETARQSTTVSAATGRPRPTCRPWRRPPRSLAPPSARSAVRWRTPPPSPARR